MLDFKTTDILTISIPATSRIEPGIVSQSPYDLGQTHYTSKPEYTNTFSLGAFIFLIWMLDFKTTDLLRAVQDLNQWPHVSKAVT